MVDGTGILGLLKSPATPLWVVAAFTVYAILKVISPILERRNERLRDRASEKSGDWKRLREELGRLVERVKDLEVQRDVQERENEKCRHDLAAAVRRIAELEGYMMGRGDALNEAQTIVSIERLEVREEKGGDDG